MKIARSIFVIVAVTFIATARAQTNAPAPSRLDGKTKAALTPAPVAARPRFIGLTITTKIPYATTNVPITAGYIKYDILQLWENNVLIKVRMAESSTSHDAGCLGMIIAKNPPRSLWVDALKLILIKEKPSLSRKEDLLLTHPEWETTCEWWTPDQSVFRRMTDVGEIPIEHAHLETALNEYISDEGVDAETLYPRINFMGFRWLHTNNKIPDQEVFQPDDHFAHWLKQKIESSPPNLFQIIRVADVQTDILNARRQWIRFPVRVSADQIIVVELFQLPRATPNVTTTQ